MVFVVVFDEELSILSSVMARFASDRINSLGASRINRKYSFEIDATRGNLRRMYRHFLLGEF